MRKEPQTRRTWTRTFDLRREDKGWCRPSSCSLGNQALGGSQGEDGQCPFPPLSGALSLQPAFHPFALCLSFSPCPGRAASRVRSWHGACGGIW